MGMYDSVYLNCPVCDCEVELQSKTGDRRLYHYKPDEVPPDVVRGLGTSHTCESCGTEFTIKSTKPQTVIISLVKKEPGEEDDDV